MAIPQRVYLIGFMGSGKSTLGKKMANKLGYHFVDTDKLIEQKHTLSIHEIFKQYGEAYFREQETLVLNSTLNMDKVIVSTGGGLPCYHNNIDTIINAGMSIYLKGDPLFLKNRLLPNQANRPLIEGLTDNELYQYVEKKLMERESFYNKAHYHVDLPIKSLETLLKSAGLAI